MRAVGEEDGTVGVQEGEGTHLGDGLGVLARRRLLEGEVLVAHLDELVALLLVLARRRLLDGGVPSRSAFSPSVRGFDPGSISKGM